MNEYKEGTDYEFVVPADKETTINIRVLKGLYRDTVYQYGKVKFSDGEDGAIYLQFVYNVLETPLDKNSLEKDMNFKNFIGDILVGIMSQNMDKGIIDETGTDYSEESDTE
jgi:hypothetical protein